MVKGIPNHIENAFAFKRGIILLSTFHFIHVSLKGAHHRKKRAESNSTQNIRTFAF